MVDLDKFKAVNDTLGHAAGDALLQGITAAMKNVLRPTDAFARWGGDEFVVLSPNELSGAVTIADRLRKAVNQFIEEQFQEKANAPQRKVSISCGVSQYYRDDSLDSLILRADKAMYKSKGKGGNQVSI